MAKLTDDWNSDEMKALGLDARGKLIMDSVAPRRYSWLTNSDGLKYLHEHEVGESPEGSFSIAAPPSVFGPTTHERNPLWYLEGDADNSAE